MEINGDLLCVGVDDGSILHIHPIDGTMSIEENIESAVKELDDWFYEDFDKDWDKIDN